MSLAEVVDLLQAAVAGMDAGGPVAVAEAPARLPSALELAADVLDDPGPWLRAPNPQLGDRPPIDLIGTDEEFRVSNLLTAIDRGLF
jgi:uncharacterized protein (DUF2384 family)